MNPTLIISGPDLFALLSCDGLCNAGVMSAPAQSAARPVIGLLAGALAVTIWAGWISATRFAMTEAVDPLVLAICRNGVPVLVLAPLILRRGLIPKNAALGPILLMTLGWGAPFAYLTSMGLSTVPASLFGPLVPGLAPILVAGLAWAVLGERPGQAIALGLVLIAMSLALVLGQWVAAGEADALGGVPFLVAACLGFSVFTISARQSGLSPVEAAGYIGLYSVPLLAVWALLRPGALAGVELGDWIFHALTQGLLTGLVAVLAYGVALRHLGPIRGSTINAMVPVAAAIVGMLALGEMMGPLDWIAVGAASLGVAAANGALTLRRGTGP